MGSGSSENHLEKKFQPFKSSMKGACTGVGVGQVEKKCSEIVHSLSIRLMGVAERADVAGERKRGQGLLQYLRTK